MLMWRLALGVLQLLVLLLVKLAFVEPAHAQANDGLAALYRQVEQLFHDGKGGDAIPMAQRALPLAKQGGSDPRGAAALLNKLAELYRKHGEYREAEPLHNEALSIREKVLNLDEPDIDVSLDQLAATYRSLERYDRAIRWRSPSMSMHCPRMIPRLPEAS
jgi:tetratricopeptide (TPR) repeat protein